MKMKTKKKIKMGIIVVIGIIMFIGAGLVILLEEGEIIAKIPFLVTVLIAIGGLIGGMSMMKWGDMILDDYNQTPQTTPVKSQPKPQKSTNPWISAPKVQVEKEEEEIPKIWKEEVLAGDIR